MPRAVAMAIRARRRKKIRSRVIVTLCRYTRMYLFTFLLIGWIFHVGHRAPVVLAGFHLLGREHLGGCDRLQQHCFVINCRTAVIEGKLVVVTQDNRFRWTSILAIAAVNTTDHVNFIRGSITLTGRETSFIRILGSFHKNRICRAGGRAERTSNTFFKPIVIALQHVTSSEARPDLPFLLGVLIRHRFFNHYLKRGPKSTHQLNDWIKRAHMLFSLIHDKPSQQ